MLHVVCVETEKQRKRTKHKSCVGTGIECNHRSKLVPKILSRKRKNNNLFIILSCSCQDDTLTTDRSFNKYKMIPKPEYSDCFIQFVLFTKHHACVVCICDIFDSTRGIYRQPIMGHVYLMQKSGIRASIMQNISTITSILHKEVTQKNRIRTSAK